MSDLGIYNLYERTNPGTIETFQKRTASKMDLQTEYEKIIEDEQHYKRFSNMQTAPERVNYGMDKDNMDIGSLLYYFDLSCDYQYDTNSFKNALS